MYNNIIKPDKIAHKKLVLPTLRRAADLERILRRVIYCIILLLHILVGNATLCTRNKQPAAFKSCCSLLLNFNWHLHTLC